MYTPLPIFATAALVCGVTVPAVSAVPTVYPMPQKAEISTKYVTVKNVKVQTKSQNASLPEKEGAYKISVRDSGAVTIFARDTLGVKYAKQTISQLLHGVKGTQNAHQDPFADKDIATVAKLGKLPVCEIEDWPDIPYRGIVEGFYSPPGWTDEGRESLIRFMGRNKMNFFIYGPKGDPYHRGQWRKPYPEKEAKNLQRLNKLAEKSGVRFVWAIHPGGQINWSNEQRMNEDFASIVKKLELMYDLGLRNFGVFFDDVGGGDGKAENQVRAMRYIVENFWSKKKDVAPLLFCPSGYNRAWTNEAYLQAIGKGFDKSIMIMWTGDTVVHDISLQGQEWFTSQTGRPAFIWWNYPCCDFCRTNLTMGPLNDPLHPQALEQDPKMKDLLIGLTSNPMDHSEASKVGLFSIASYAWNIMGFNSDKTWRDSIKRLYPECPVAMQVFCNHNSDLGPNNHGYRKDESIEMQPIVKSAIDSLKNGTLDKKALKTLESEFVLMRKSARTMQEKLPQSIMKESAQKTPDNPDAYKEYNEIGTWVKAFEYTSAAGAYISKSILSQSGSNEELHWYTKATDMLDRYARINSSYNQTPSQSGIKVCSRVMRPAIDEMLNIQGENLYRHLGGNNTSKAIDFSPSASSSAKGFAKLLIDENEKKIGVGRVLEFHTLNKGDYIKLSVPGAIKASWVEINLGCNIRNWAKVTLTLADGSKITPHFEEWKPNIFVLRNKAVPSQPIAEMELVNTGDPRDVNIEMFKFDVERDATDSVSVLTDGRLHTTYRLLPDASVTLKCPQGSKQGVVIASSNVKITGATTDSFSAGKISFKLNSDAKEITLRADSQGAAIINEVIFR